MSSEVTQYPCADCGNDLRGHLAEDCIAALKARLAAAEGRLEDCRLHHPDSGRIEKRQHDALIRMARAVVDALDCDAAHHSYKVVVGQIRLVEAEARAILAAASKEGATS